jgi:sodium/potassium-transporting ATPase subunit alpha
LEVLLSDLLGALVTLIDIDSLKDFFFLRDVQFIGLMMWPCAMSMWFLYMSHQGLGFYDVILVYNKWTDGYKGFTIEQLTDFVLTGQCI